MDDVSTEALRLILQTGEILGDVKANDGKKLFDRIVEYQEEDKYTKMKENTLEATQKSSPPRLTKAKKT